MKLKSVVLMVMYIFGAENLSAQVTFPKLDGSTILSQGQKNVPITWGNPGTGNVSIELYQGTPKILTIVSSTANNGSYNLWTVPSSQAPASNYRIRIAQTGTGGWSNYSEYFTITTPAAGKPTVTTSSANSITSTGATLNGTINPNYAYTTYYFDYGTSASCGSHVGYSSLNAGGTAQSVSYSLSTLNPSTTYYFQLVASNSAGTTTSSPVLQFTTSAPPLPNSPTLSSPANGANANVGSQVDLTWGAVNGATEYYLQLKKGSTLVWDATVGNVTTESFSAAFLGTAGTFYWKVRAKNSVGWGNYSTEFVFNYIDTSPLSPPTLVSPISGANVNATTVNFAWQGVSGAAEYWLQVTTSASFNAPYFYDGTAGTNAILGVSGFPNDGTAYYWRVKTKNSSGVWGNYNSTVFVNGYTPLQVTSVTINVTPTTVNLGQSATGSGTINGSGSGLVTYQWEYLTPGGSTWQQYNTSINITMTNGSATIPSITLAPPFDTPGIYLFRVRITSPNAVTSNIPTVTVNAPPKPDLIITSVSTDISSIQVGGSFNVTYTIKNNGAGSPGSSQTTGIYLSSTQYGIDRLLFVDAPIASSFLSSGTSKTSTIGGILPSDVVPGNYYIVAYANYNGAVGETDAGNNTNGKAVTVVKFSVSPATISVSPTTVTQGGSSTGSGSIMGTGSGTVSYVWEYLTPGGSTWQQYNTSINITMTNGSATIPSITLAPPFDTPGIYTFRVRITSPNAVTSNLPMVTVNELPKPDLIITSVSTDISSIQLGGSFNVTYTIKNNGPGNPGSSQTTGIYLSSTQYGIDRLLFVDAPIASSALSSGASKTSTIGGILPSDVVPGNYYIVAYANYNSAVGETDAGNNTNGKAVTVVRFAVTGVIASVTPSTLNEGETITKSGNITGTGSGTVTYRWEEKDPGSSTWNPIQDKTVTMTNGTATIPSVQIASYAPVGTHYHRVAVTSPNTFTSNEIGVTVNLSPTLLLSVNDIGTGLTPFNYSGKQGTLVRLGATLYRNVLGMPLIILDSKNIHFEIQLSSGVWSAIPEDGITTTNMTTSSAGVDENYYLIPDDLEGNKDYPLRAVFDGDAQYAGSTKQGNLTVVRPVWDTTRISTHSVGLGIPLILVHGNRNDKSSDLPMSRWDSLKTFIKANENLFKEFDVFIWHHDTEIPIGFNGTTGNAKQLAQFIIGLKKKVILVAHSRGGLVCRSYMNHYGDADSVLGLITLATPHHGSPSAVPDWSAWVWSNNVNPTTLGDIISLSLFNTAVGTEPTSYVVEEINPVFDYDRIGSLNLAWDNQDQVMGNNYFSFDWSGVSFANNATIQFSPRDLNTSSSYGDMTILYPDQAKNCFGTLEELNRTFSQNNFQKIIAYGAYDIDITESENGALTTTNLAANAITKKEHKGLALLTALMAHMHEGISSTINYVANDGMVPLQSALCLDVSGGTQFSQNNSGIVTRLQPNIDARKQVKTHRIFNNINGIKDHLDLLDASLTNPTTLIYWTTLASDIRSFIPDQSNPTPVEINSFSAILEGEDVQVCWSTATEVNNYGFDVERRIVGDTSDCWQTIHFVDGAGTSNSSHKYSYSDKNPSPGRYSYRIKQIDRDGAFKYYGNAEVEIVVPSTFALEQNYPNPFNPSTTIRYALPNPSSVRLVITNALGQQVVVLENGERDAGYHDIEWRANVASGIYFYRIDAVSTSDPNNRFVQIKKMLLLR